MIINSKSLCNSCIHATSCSLTSNNNFIWSCSEYEKQPFNNQKSEPILTSSFNITESGEKIEIF